VTPYDDSAEIEVLTFSHVAEIVELLQRVYGEAQHPIGGTWNKDLIKQELKIGQGIGLRDDKLGLIAFVLYRFFDEHREITLLATHPERQRRGDMKFLLTYLLERKSPQERIWLEVHEKNEPARQLYGVLGFQEVGRRPKYYRDGGDAVLYTLG
jgi:ribosomal-protein-alanine N-acetyltransferase